MKTTHLRTGMISLIVALLTLFAPISAEDPSGVRPASPELLGILSRGSASYEVYLEAVPIGEKNVYNVLFKDAKNKKKGKKSTYIGFYRVMNKPLSVKGDTILFDHAVEDGNAIRLKNKYIPSNVELDTAQVNFRKNLNDRFSSFYPVSSRELPPVAYSDSIAVQKGIKPLKSRPFTRVEESFNHGWTFALADAMNKETMSEIPENRWRLVDLPHDWSIEHPVNSLYPTGSSGGYVKTGVGMYKKVFTLPKDWNDRNVELYFGGIQMNAEVYLNDNFLGMRPYGYTSYALDLSPFINRDGKPNTLWVRVDNSKQRSARWYTGSGINQNVKLIITDPVHVDVWGTYILTESVSEKNAQVKVDTTIKNNSLQDEGVMIEYSITSPTGEIVAQTKSGQVQTKKQSVEHDVQVLNVPNPQLWEPGAPHLYTLITTIKSADKVIDSYETTFGIRNLRFDADLGFFINEKALKLKGVCLHEDGGETVGNAVPIDIWERRFKILQEMGCNAIRTSHNPFSDEFYDLADRMGILIIAEAFDEWKFAKREFTYADHFDEWAERDLRDFMRRTRNHPSIIMWSIGNEIPDLQMGKGAKTAEYLCKIVKDMDLSRPTTVGMKHFPDKNDPVCDVIDVIGVNFGHRPAKHRKETLYLDYRKHHGKQFIYGSETTHSYQTRGAYNTITHRKQQRLQPNLSKTNIFEGQFNDNYHSSYDNSFIEHHNRHSLIMMRDTPWIAGEFRWTGIDYLGEAANFPTRYKDFGIIDMCGFPKDTYYLYQSVWADSTVLHILPHWTWPKMEGVLIPVWVYANQCDSVELFLDGKSLGKKAYDLDKIYVSWDVPYAAGELKAISYKGTKIVKESQISTASQAAKIELSIDKQTIRPNHTDLVHVEVTIVDSRGNLVPKADHMVTFSVQGPANLLGIDNGDLLDITPSTHTNQRKVFHGKCLAVIQSKFTSGTVKLIVEASGLPPAEYTISIKGTAPSIMHSSHVSDKLNYAMSDEELNLNVPSRK